MLETGDFSEGLFSVLGGLFGFATIRALDARARLLIVAGAAHLAG
jgi:hypothetical protein